MQYQEDRTTTISRAQIESRKFLEIQIIRYIHARKDWNIIILIVITINFDCKSVDNTHHKFVIILLSYQWYNSNSY